MAACTFAVGTADTGATPNTSGSFTPALNDLLVVFVGATANADATATLTSSLGGGFTFTQFAARTHSTSHRMFAFVADQLVSSATGQTVTADMPAGASGTIIFVWRVSGITKTGLTAILQSATNNAALGTTPNVTFSNSCLTGNPTLVALANTANPAAVTPPTSWTEPATGDLGHGSPNHGGETASLDSGFTGTTITWASNSSTAWGAIGVEIDSSAAAATKKGGLSLMGMGR